MKYISTRGGYAQNVCSAFAIRQGLADDGGLFVPEEIPKVNFEFIKALSEMPYYEKAAKILSLYLTDYSYDELLALSKEAYSAYFFPDGCAPVVHLDDKLSILELWHGPTCAFKDMALQLMPKLFLSALKKCNEKRNALILTATSGDTGKAALEGFKDLDGVYIKVYYPTDGVSVMQKRQMQTQTGSNVSVKGIYGHFDDAQNGVKKAFADKELEQKLCKNNFFLSSANSINWGRLAPQLVYYFSAYCDMINSGRINFGEKIDLCVPTGNFGNILAGFISKRMGLPIGKLICASNSNDVLTEFLRHGKYTNKRPFFATSSPSMDILVSSNLERLIYLYFGQDRCKELMNKFEESGEYTLTHDELETIRNDFEGYSTNDTDCDKCIKKIFEEKKYLIDTHTAVALCATERYMREYETSKKILVLSTATPYKFASDVLKSTFGIETKPEDATECLQKMSRVPIPSPISSLWEKKILHNTVINTSNMVEDILDFIKENAEKFKN